MNELFLSGTILTLVKTPTTGDTSHIVCPVSYTHLDVYKRQYQNDPTKPNFGSLTATTYGDGAKISSRYDDLNRVTGVVYGEESAPRYEYDYNAKGQVARVRDNLLNRTTQSEYDLSLIHISIL